ncbi:MAG: hypothetical protein ACYCWW_18290 [Deltaproteobacteria bacterium]
MLGVAIAIGLAGRLAMAAPTDDRSETPTAWAACPEAGVAHSPLFLGRFGHGRAILEVGPSNGAAIARLWAKASPGGPDLDWPGGRPGYRQLVDPKLWQKAAPGAQGGRVYLWTSSQGWNGGEVVPILGVELAKSLCDPRAIVAYLVLKVTDEGAGYAVGSFLPPPPGADAPPAVPEDSPRAVVNQIYQSITARLEQGLLAQRLLPSSVAINVYPGHFTGKGASPADRQYAVSLRWGNAFDDRFSLLYLADAQGKLTSLVDRQEGGSGGAMVQAADLDGDGTDEIFYEVNTLDGSSAAVWSLKGGAPHAVVQTTPVGE